MRGTLRGSPVILLRFASWCGGLSRLLGATSGLLRCSNCSRVYCSPCADKHLKQVSTRVTSEKHLEAFIQGKMIFAKG